MRAIFGCTPKILLENHVLLIICFVELVHMAFLNESE